MWGITETERKRWAKEARQKRDKKKEDYEAGVWRGHDLAQARDPVMELLRPVLAALYREGSRSANMVVQWIYDGKGTSNTVTLAIPHDKYTKKSLTEWLEDSTAFSVNAEASIFSAHMKDWKLMVAAIKAGNITGRIAYDPNKRERW